METEIIYLDLDNIDTKQTEQTQLLLQKEAYEKSRELFCDANAKLQEFIKDNKIIKNISDCRRRNTVMVAAQRGAGKTFFLLNIENYLQSTVQDFASKFHFFKPIDPTLLHKNENFLTVILAKLLNELEPKKYDEKLTDNQKKELYEKLSDVADAIDGFDSSQKNTFQIISRDQSGLKLEQHIHDFFGLVCKALGDKQLVLLIDDVDMAFDKGYEVLEVVRKYLASPYIIPVVSGDMDLYTRIIRKEFADNLGVKQIEVISRFKNRNLDGFTNDLTNDYLGKLFEHKSQIFLKRFKELNNDLGKRILLVDKHTKKDKGQLDKQRSLKIFFENIEFLNIQESINKFSLRKFLSLAKETSDVVFAQGKQPISQEMINSRFEKIEKKYGFTIDRVTPLIEQGEKLNSDGDFDGALEQYNKALEIDANGRKKRQDEIYFKIGNVYSNKDETDKAIEAYQKVIELNPKRDAAYYNLGVAYSKKDETNKAIEAYQKAIELNPKYDAAYNNLGSAYGKKDETNKAIEAYQKAIELNPKRDAAYYNLGVAYSKKDETNKAIEAYQKAIELNPKLDAAYDNLGSAYTDKGDFDKAIEAYQKAIELNPKYDAVYYNLGSAYSKKNDFNKAIEAYQKAIELNPKRDAAYYTLGIAYSKKDETNKAIEAYQKAIELNPKSDAAYTNLFELWLIHGMKFNQEIVHQFKANSTDKKALMIYDMLLILKDSLVVDSDLTQALQLWEMKYKRIKESNFRLKELMDWKAKHPYPEKLEQALEVFKKHFI